MEHSTPLTHEVPHKRWAATQTATQCHTHRHIACHHRVPLNLPHCHTNTRLPGNYVMMIAQVAATKHLCPYLCIHAHESKRNGCHTERESSP